MRPNHSYHFEVEVIMTTDTTVRNRRPCNNIVRLGERVVILNGPHAEKVGVVTQRSPAGCYVALDDVPVHQTPFILLRDLVGERELRRQKAESSRGSRVRYIGEEEE